MKVLRIVGAAIVAVIVIAVLLLVIGIPAGFVTSTIQAQVEQQTGYRITVSGATKVGVWPSLNVTVNDVTLENPKNRDTASRLTADSIQADMTLASVLAGKLQITELAIVRPVLVVPLLRERIAPSNAPSKPAAPSNDIHANDLTIDRVTVTDGTVAFSNLRDRVENRIEGINADIQIGGDRKIKIAGSARAGEHPLKFEIKATAPAPPLERQNIPVELTLDVPGVLRSPLAGSAQVRLNGSVVMINGLTGTLDDGAFNGWASADLSSKPLVKLDLDFQRLNVGMSGARAASGPWSNAPIDLTGLNYADAQARISAADLTFGDAHFAPASMDATLADGVLKVRFANLGVYGGQADGDLTVDASTANPNYTLRSDLVGVRALPLLKSAADFDKLDGKMQAKIGVRSTGNSQRTLMSNLNGAVFANFRDGAIKGINVAAMIRSLTSGTLSGWQEAREQATDLTQLSASFRIDKGQANSNDLNLVGPLVRMTGAGTIDLAAKSLAFRVEPKLVMTTQGQGRAADPVGLGIPVMIDGPWAEPRIYPDMQGILDNPDAAYARLKEMGKGLFGGAGGGLGGLGGSGLSDQLGGKLGETLGNLLQQGLSQGRNIPGPSAPVPAAPSAQTDPAQPSLDDAAMDSILRQLFNR